MRHLTLLLLAAGCSSNGPTTQALCVACAVDGNCGGNPCYQDQSGGHFCGAPCTQDSDCPGGFACLALPGSSGQVSQTCFPRNGSCANSPVSHPGQDMSVGGGGDGGGGNGDMGGIKPPPTCTVPKGGNVTLAGPNNIDRIYFGYTGDTRDNSSGAGYSSQLNTIIRGIYTSMSKLGVSFAVDGGDHMEASSFSDAQACMNDYQSAAALLAKPVFMTMGNHECSLSFSSDCGGGAWMTDSHASAYMATLTQMTGATTPWYRFDVMTNSGKATFIVVADDAWDSTEQSWLTTQLTDADANSKYTFVSKHHPFGNSDQATFPQIETLIKQHKYTLYMTGHSHEYKHEYTDHRAFRMGLGGAPFDNPSQNWNGYLTAMQCPDDHIYVTVYDSSTGSMMDSWAVPPQ